MCDKISRLHTKTHGFIHMFQLKWISVERTWTINDKRQFCGWTIQTIALKSNLAVCLVWKTDQSIRFGLHYSFHSPDSWLSFKISIKLFQMNLFLFAFSLSPKFSMIQASTLTFYSGGNFTFVTPDIKFVAVNDSKIEMLMWRKPKHKVKTVVFFIHSFGKWNPEAAIRMDK